MKRPTMSLRRLSLKGLRVAPAQVCGGVRLVPLIRERVREDLRLWQRPYGEDLVVGALNDSAAGRGLRYVSYVPHGLVLRFSDDGEPVAAWGAQFHEPGPARRAEGLFRVRALHRMVKRERQEQLRLLPLHLAMEGFLELAFGGPDIAWPEYARPALRFGLSPRIEWSISGRGLSGLDRALRLFEIHAGQCGVLLYVMDALAAAFVVPHSEDYHALHRTLLEDFFGPELLEYSHLPYRVPELAVPPQAPGEGPLALADLRAALVRCKDEWRSFHALMVYQAGPFRLERFLTELDPEAENHLGEVIVREDGTVEYLKTYRLSARQTERAQLLQTLSAHHFNVSSAAVALKLTRERLILRLCTAGFTALFKPEVVQDAYLAVHGTRHTDLRRRR